MAGAVVTGLTSNDLAVLLSSAFQAAASTRNRSPLPSTLIFAHGPTLTHTDPAAKGDPCESAFIRGPFF